MNRDAILTAVKSLNLPTGEFIIFGSCPLAVVGIRDSNDIDLVISRAAYRKLEQDGWEFVDNARGRKSAVRGVFDIHTAWDFGSYNPTLKQLLSRADIVDGIPVASLHDVKKWKAISARPKDIEDIKKIDTYLRPKRGKQVTVFGASGKVGRLVVAEALARGYKVVAVVHKHNPFEPADKLRVVKGDVYNGADVAKAIKGSRIVVSCLGSWGRKTRQGNRNVLTSAMLEILPAMKAQNIERIVTLTGSGAVAPATKPGRAHRYFMRLLAPFPAGKVFRDGEQHMRLLQASGLAWTTIRSPIMSKGRRTGYTLSHNGGMHVARIPRQAVATAIVDQLENLAWLRKAPVIKSAK